MINILILLVLVALLIVIVFLYKTSIRISRQLHGMTLEHIKKVLPLSAGDFDGDPIMPFPSILSTETDNLRAIYKEELTFNDDLVDGCEVDIIAYIGGSNGGSAVCRINNSLIVIELMHLTVLNNKSDLTKYNPALLKGERHD